MKCSIIIRSYNEEEHIGKLLLGLREQHLQPHEIILVDSGSTDRTRDIARQFEVKIINIRKEEFSFGRALNIGCAAASGDILVFVSAHVYPVHRTWLERLVAPFEDERVVLSYGRQRGNHLTKFSEAQIFEKWFPPQSVCPQKTYFCNNANCAVRREAWERRPYDEMLSGLEDIAWAKAAQEEGGWLAYAADAVIVHVHEENWASIRNRYRREAMAMRKIDPSAHFSLIDLLRLTPSNIIADFRAAWRRDVLHREFLDIILFRINQFWGTYQGYRGPEEISAELKKRFYFPAPHAHGPIDPPELEAHKINYETLTSRHK